MIFGIDEVGRGCWAGPLVVAAVSLEHPIDGLNDSKKLSRKDRQELLETIRSDNNKIIIASIDSKELDKLGLTNAMKAACEQLFSSISNHSYDKVIIDGNINYLAEKNNTEFLVNADASLPECMAASIVAKEFRDEYMRKLSEKYPKFGFESHVGYGTKKHAEAIEKYGIIDEHRKSFKPIKKYVSN